MKENRRKEITRLWRLCKETNAIEKGSVLYACYSRMEHVLRERLSLKVYYKMIVAITCFSNHAQDKRFAVLLLKKLNRYWLGK